MSSVIVETRRSIWFGAPARILEHSREMAWAEKHVTHNPAFRWILGKFVEADQPNNNGHIFALEDLRSAQDTLLHAPLNLIHQPGAIVGAFVGNEIVYPTGEEVAGLGIDTKPYMEALAAFWHYHFPEHYKLVEKAHSEGALFYSMEAIPQTVTCKQADCEREFEYAGRMSPTYCAHLNGPGRQMKLNQPHFMGGALIFPPVRPGWRHADITEMSSLIESHALEAEMAYEQMKVDFPHLGPPEWEALMAYALAEALGGPDAKDQVHPYLGSEFDDVSGEMAGPCDICGRDEDSPVHDTSGSTGEERASWEVVSAILDYPLDVLIARQFTTEKRKELADKGHALPDGSYPIENIGDLKNAIQAVGRAPANKRAQVKAHIKKRAQDLGAENLLPDGWD